MYYSTRKNSKKVSFEEAVMLGMATDGGLFMPENLAPLENEKVPETISRLAFPELAFRVLSRFNLGMITESDLADITEEAFTFQPVLNEISPDVFALELFHGPTLAFKDFGAQFLAAVLSRIAGKTGRELMVLVATSGDTGSAVAHAFSNKAGVRVTLLYPKGKVSKIQEQQLTVNATNVQALAVEGTFDDCQRMVKQAFANEELTSRLSLTSANSINIARLLPQSIYYVFAGLSLWKSGKAAPVFSVPCGNLGNLTAGLLAKMSGFPAHHFVAATNSNRIFPDYLEHGVFQPKSSVKTMSNAMDVGNPSNFERLSCLYSDDLSRMWKDISGISVSEEETASAMLALFQKHNYLADPHSAIAWKGLTELRTKHFPERPGVFLCTAHPFKFWEEVKTVTGVEVAVPDRLSEILKKEGRSVTIPVSSEALYDFLIS